MSVCNVLVCVLSSHGLPHPEVLLLNVRDCVFEQAEGFLVLEVTLHLLL